METESNADYLIFDIGKMQYAIPMKYVAAVMMETEQFPSCIPPKTPAYIECVIQIEQVLVPIVDLAQVPGYRMLTKRENPYPLVLILSYQSRQVGLLTDHMTIQTVDASGKAENGAIGQQLFINLDGKHLVLFDVPKFFSQLEEGQTGPAAM